MPLRDACCPTKLRAGLFLLSVLVVCAAMSMSCGRRASRSQEPVDGWSHARAKLSEGSRCYLDDARYCPRDPAFIDPIIQQTLQKHFHGKMPTTRSGADQVAWHASSEYEEAWQTQTGFALVSKLFVQHYTAPEVTVQPDRVLIDVGVPPGLLTYVPNPHPARRGTVRYDSKLVVDRELVSTELGRLMEQHVPAHAAAKAVELRVLIPTNLSGPGKEIMAYRYRPSDHRIVVATRHARGAARYLVVPNGDLGSIAAGHLSVRSKALQVCRRSDRSCRWISP